jgi:hypothetical protein
MLWKSFGDWSPEACLEIANLTMPHITTQVSGPGTHEPPMVKTEVKSPTLPGSSPLHFTQNIFLPGSSSSSPTNHPIVLCPELNAALENINAAPFIYRQIKRCISSDPAYPQSKWGAILLDCGLDAHISKLVGLMEHQEK